MDCEIRLGVIEREPGFGAGGGHLYFVEPDILTAVVRRGGPGEVDLRGPVLRRGQSGRARRGGDDGVRDVRRVARTDGVDGRDPVMAGQAGLETGIAVGRLRIARVGDEVAEGGAPVGRDLDLVARDILTAVFRRGGPGEVDLRAPVRRRDQVEGRARRGGAGAFGGAPDGDRYCFARIVPVNAAPFDFEEIVYGKPRFTGFGENRCSDNIRYIVSATLTAVRDYHIVGRRCCEQGARRNGICTGDIILACGNVRGGGGERRRFRAVHAVLDERHYRPALGPPACIEFQVDFAHGVAGGIGAGLEALSVNSFVQGGGGTRSGIREIADESGVRRPGGRGERRDDRRREQEDTSRREAVDPAGPRASRRGSTFGVRYSTLCMFVGRTCARPVFCGVFHHFLTPRLCVP